MCFCHIYSVISTNPGEELPIHIFKKLWCRKKVKKKECNDLQILQNLCLIDNSTKTTYMYGSCLYLFFSLHGRVLPALLMQQCTRFTDNGFQRCSWAHAVISTIDSCFNAVPPEGPKVTAIQYWFSVLSLAYRDLLILQITDDEILKSLCNFTLRNILLQLLSYVITQSFTE